MFNSDLEIENTLIEILKKIVEEKRPLTCGNLMPKLSVFWDSADSCWNSKKEADPLSLFLITKKPERERRSEDDEAIATLSVALNRRPAWIQSFIFGWSGLNNQSTSINGFLLGDKLRRQFTINYK